MKSIYLISTEQMRLAKCICKRRKTMQVRKGQVAYQLRRLYDRSGLNSPCAQLLGGQYLPNIDIRLSKGDENHRVWPDSEEYLQVDHRKSEILTLFLKKP